jgi:hypothetical protein
MNRRSFFAVVSEKRRDMQRSAEARLMSLFGSATSKKGASKKSRSRRDDDDDLPGPNATVPMRMPMFAALAFG